MLAARSVDHGRLALDVLRSGKHLFLEKPGATTIEEHDVLRRECAARPGQVVQVGYMGRYDVAFADAHRRVRGGEAGDPLVVLLTSRDTEWPEGEDPHDTGGFLLDMASHDYDAACWLLGDEAVDVTASRQSLVYPELAGLGDLDNARGDDSLRAAAASPSRTCRGLRRSATTYGVRSWERRRRSSSAARGTGVCPSSGAATLDSTRRTTPPVSPTPTWRS